MGFRDLKCFNHALLAKQIWRLVEYPSSLLATILKARYYKHSTILEANRGFNPSFTWRSMWGAKALLKEGLGWRVGNESSICCKNDKWLLHNGIFISPIFKNENAPDYRVCDYIDAEARSWNIALIDEVFDHSTKKIILATPLAPNASADTMFWGASRNGRYSVKSGYWLGFLGLVSLQPNDDNSLWHMVWSVQGPPKPRHFIWRACKGSLPVNVVRFQRHMHSSARCTRSENDDESIFHALLDCNSSQVVWLNTPFSSLIHDTPRDSFASVFSWLCTHTPKDDIPTICVVLWACWMGRNQVVMENVVCDVSRLSISLCKLVNAYRGYNQKIQSMHIPCVSTHDSWYPPSARFVKINFDAHVSVGDSRGLGVVLRDDKGSIILTGTRKVQARWNVELSEAFAAYGLMVANRMGYKRIHLEGDAFNVIVALHKKEQGLSPLHLVYDCCFELFDNFEIVMFSHVHRVGNTVAHMIASGTRILTLRKFVWPLFLSVFGYWNSSI